MRIFKAGTLLALFVLSGGLFAQTADTLVITVQPTTVRANQTFTVAVEAQDSTSGNAVDTGYTSTVTLTVGSGPGTLGGTTALAAVAGVATFSNLTLDTVGTVTINADDGSLATATSAGIDVTADRLIITTDASNTTAGATISGPGGIVVEARDGNGNTDASFTGSVDVAIVSGTGTLNGTTTQAAVAGVATFDDLSINEADTFTFDFTAVDLATATTVSFDVTPDAASQLAFAQQPTNATVNTVISPDITVEIQDQFGNLVTSATDAVTLAINSNPGGATLGGTATQAAVSGVATFDDITLDASGTGYTLDATATGLAGGTSSAFDVSAAATPTITVSSSMTAFNTTGIGVPSSEQSYTVEGADLTDDITISPPPHLEISQSSGSGFDTTPILLAQTGGSVGSTTIFVRYNPSTAGPHSGDITHTSAGALQQDLAVSGSIAAAAAASLSAGTGNPGNQAASPGSTRVALVFRITETGGGTDYDVTTATVNINTSNNTGGVAVSALSSASLRRSGAGTVLDTVTNGGTGWSVSGNVVTVSFSGFSSVVSAGSNGDFIVSLTFSSTPVPSPNPSYICDIDPSGVNGGAGIGGTTVSGGTITLRDDLPDDPFAEDDDDDDSCDLSTRGGPAWPMAACMVAVALLALRRRWAA